jgi:hypothetical protein
LERLLRSLFPVLLPPLSSSQFLWNNQWNCFRKKKWKWMFEKKHN